MISVDKQEDQVWMLKTGLLGRNLSFNTQIKTDGVGNLAEGRIHSDPRETAVKSWGEHYGGEWLETVRPRSSLVGSPHFLHNPSSGQNKLAGPAGAWLSVPLECRTALHRLSRHKESITFGLQPRLIICYESLCSHKIK